MYTNKNWINNQKYKSEIRLIFLIIDPVVVGVWNKQLLNWNSSHCWESLECDYLSPVQSTITFLSL